jgi:hypothetical protein
VEDEQNYPPESGGQHDRDVVEIVRGVVPITICLGFGTTPARFARFPLLTQEGNSQDVEFIRTSCRLIPNSFTLPDREIR